MQPVAPTLSSQADIAKTMQPQNMYVSSGNNSSGNPRSNQQSGIFRPPPASNTPRGSGGGGARHLHMQTMYPNVVLQQYPAFAQRQPTYQTPHVQYASHIPFYPYQYIPALPQQPPHPRTGVAVNTNVNIGNTMPVQPGPNGPLAGPGPSNSQMQMLTGAVQPGTNAVIGVASSGSGQVGVPPMVTVMPGSVAPQPAQVPPTNRRLHKHRLQIIDPTTKRNILEDLNKSNSDSDIEYKPDGTIIVSQAKAVAMCKAYFGTIPPPKVNVRYKVDRNPAQRQDNVGQTPIVSAMSDAPSVEILPTPQKKQSKKIPIVSPKDDPEPSAEFSPPKVDDAAAKSSTTNATNEVNHNMQSDCASQQTNQQNLSQPQKSQRQPQGQAQNQQEQAHLQYMANASSPSEEIDVTVSKTLTQSGTSELPTKPVHIQNSAVEQENDSQIVPLLKPVTTTVEIPTGDSHAEIKLQSQPLASNEACQSSELVEDESTMHITESIMAATKTAVIAPAPSISSKVSEPLTMGQTDAHTPPQSSHESTPDETDRAQMLLAEETSVTTSATVKENPVEKVEKDTTSNLIEPTNSAIADDPGTEQEKLIERENEHELKTGSEVEIVAEAATDSEVASLINYNVGQWSPSNPSGKKQYDREQLLLLREAKASRVQPEVKNVSILPHPNMMPLFMRNNNNNNNKRVQSMVGMIGGNRNSESGSNFAGKQISMSGVQGGRGSSMKGMIHVNLSLNQDVKLNETENAWRPRLQTKVEVEPSRSEVKSTNEKDELVRRVRGILNKLTPERFDTLVEEIVKLKIDTPDKMDEVIVLVFEKAIDEPNFSVSYARLCHRLISEVKARDERMESFTKSNLQHFRNALLDKTEKEFTQNVSQDTAKGMKLQPIVEKIKTCNDPNEKAELEALLEEEERKIRRRSGGTVRFIGELFKISMLTGKIIHSCIDTLLNPQSEDMLECLCKLLTTVGAKFEQTPINTKEPSRCYSLEKPIGRMQSIASKGDKDGAKVSSRVRFMLQDVIDLRKNKWQTSRNEAPKTMGQIEKEAKNEQLSAQYMNYSGSLSTSSPNGPQSGKRDDRSGARFGDSRSTGGYGGSHSQRGDGGGNMRHQQSNNSGGSGNGNNGGGAMSHSNGNNDDNTWHVQTSKGSRSQAVDSIKLEGLSLQLNQNFDNKKMGGVNQFLWNNSANRQSSTPTTTPSNSFAVLSSLIDKSSTERDRDRDRSGPRNKGSYNKGSMERDRYSDRGIHSRTGSSQGSRENSSSRVGQNQQSRGMMNPSMQKSASHSKYTQQQAPPSRLSNKSLGNSLSSSGASGSGIYRGSDQQQPSSSASASITASASQSAKGVAPPATFTEPRECDIKLFKSVLSEMVTLAEASSSVTPMVLECIKQISEPQRCGLLFYILTDYLHLSNVGKKYRIYLATTVVHLIQQNFMSVDHFKIAYKHFSDCAMDLMFDVPELWRYVLEFAGPLIVKEYLTVSDLWNQNLRDNSEPNMCKKFLKTYLTYCTREVGPKFTRNMWKQFNMRWSDFMPDNEVIEFIELNKFEYVENDSKAPVIEQRESPEKHIQNVIDHIEFLLVEGATADSIIDYSNGNIVVADKLFIRGLTQTLSNFAIVYKENSYKLDSEIFQKFCIPVFQRYIDSNEDLQLECLYGVQLFVHSLEHPRGLLSELFVELYDGILIQKELLFKWRDSKDQSAGKGVAVKSLNPFFNSLYNDDAN